MKKMNAKAAAALAVAGIISMGTNNIYALGAEGTSTAELGLADGTWYMDAELEGGSGRASITSPMKIELADGEATAYVEFSSPNYDYVLLDGEKYLPVSEVGEDSVFALPIDGFDYAMPLTADTTAMSTPHEIDYTITIDSSSASQEMEDVTEAEAVPEEETEPVQTAAEALPQPAQMAGLTWDHAMDLRYATCFRVDYYQDGFKLLTIRDDASYLLVPEGAEAPEGLDPEIRVLQAPISSIYMVATSAMDHFAAIDALDTISLSGTNADGWYVSEAKEAMEKGEIRYAGKYSAPDYETIVSTGCDLALESTMIYHQPEVKEKLESFGIPVMVEHSSYEQEPLGRAEWIRFYGALTDREDAADAFFKGECEKVDKAASESASGKTVAFFSIGTDGSVTVRRSGDYIAKMIAMAGGDYIFKDLGDETSTQSTVKMTMEEFYATCLDADYLIYNSTIEGEVSDLAGLIGKSALMADFTAVKEGHAWCITSNLFQKTTGLADMIVDMHEIFTNPEAADQLTYMYRLK